MTEEEIKKIGNRDIVLVTKDDRDNELVTETNWHPKENEYGEPLVRTSQCSACIREVLRTHDAKTKEDREHKKHYFTSVLMLIKYDLNLGTRTASEIPFELFPGDEFHTKTIELLRDFPSVWEEFTQYRGTLYQYGQRNKSRFILDIEKQISEKQNTTKEQSHASNARRSN
jgi:hypothetical protein